MEGTSTLQKTITIGIPCYNSSEYMDNAISAILEGSDYADDVEIVIVDDGSTKDDTWEKAQGWERRFPNIVKAVHQENGGHGTAVLTALANARGVYYKVCDSDDWYSTDAFHELLGTLRGFIEGGDPVDLVINNYVYEHADDGSSKAIDYRSALKPNKVMTWDEIGHFGYAQNILMHSLTYKTEILRSHGGLPLPPHTFYVDNIYAFVPLPRCKTLYYLDVDLYRYYIGREDQSVNEKVMASRIDHQLRVSKILIDAYHLYDDVKSVKLRNYMLHSLTMTLTVSAIFARLSDVPGAMDDMTALWEYFKSYDIRMYRHARMTLLGILANLPTKAGEAVTIGTYRIAHSVFGFN